MSDPKEAPISGEQAAINFTRDHMHRMEKSLNTTRIVACVLVGFVFLYMSYIAGRLRENLTHENLSSLLVSRGEELINQHVPPMIADAQARLPEMIRNEAPKYVASLLPELRVGLQDQATNFFNKAVLDLAPQIDQAIGDLIGTRKADVKAYLETMKELKAAPPERRQALEQRARALVRLMVTELLDSLEAVAEVRQFDNPDLDLLYRRSLSTLRAGNQEVKRLATGPKLTKDDEDLRYAVAVLLEKVDWSSPVLTPPPRKVRPPKTPKSGGNNATKPAANP